MWFIDLCGALSRIWGTAWDVHILSPDDINGQYEITKNSSNVVSERISRQVFSHGSFPCGSHLGAVFMDWKDQWISIHPDPQDKMFTISQVNAFMEEIERFFYNAFKLRLGMLQLSKVMTTIASVTSNGVFKLHSQDYIVDVLRLLCSFSAEKLAFMWQFFPHSDKLSNQPTDNEQWITPPHLIWTTLSFSLFFITLMFVFGIHSYTHMYIVPKKSVFYMPWHKKKSKYYIFDWESIEQCRQV